MLKILLGIFIGIILGYCISLLRIKNRSQIVYLEGEINTISFETNKSHEFRDDKLFLEKNSSVKIIPKKALIIRFQPKHAGVLQFLSLSEESIEHIHDTMVRYRGSLPGISEEDYGEDHDFWIFDCLINMPCQKCGNTWMNQYRKTVKEGSYLKVKCPKCGCEPPNQDIIENNSIEQKEEK